MGSQQSILKLVVWYQLTSNQKKLCKVGTCLSTYLLIKLFRTMKCLHCNKEFDSTTAELNAQTYHKSVRVACPLCGQLHYVRPVISFKVELASPYDNSKTDDWGTPVNTYRKIELNKPLFVVSVDFDDNKISSMDNIYHSTKELFDWLNNIKKELPKQTLKVTLREFTFQEVDDIHWEEDFWQYDWLECFKHKVIEEFVY